MNLAVPNKAPAPPERRPFDQQPALAVMTQPQEPEANVGTGRFELLSPQERIATFYCQQCGREKKIGPSLKATTGHCQKCDSMWFATWPRGQEPRAGDLGSEWHFEVFRPEPKQATREA
jgi:hypothetical protein